jgi:hypothetical protein
MTESQRHGIAAGFLHILQTHDDVYKRWMATPKNDAEKIGALIREEMGLKEAPDKPDLDAMAKYIDAHLKDQVEKIQAANKDAPKHVGLITVTQQNS